MKHPRLTTTPSLLRRLLSSLLLVTWVGAGLFLVQHLTSFLLVSLVGAAQFQLHYQFYLCLLSILNFIFSLLLIIHLPARLSRKFATTREELGLTSLPTWTDIWLAVVAFIFFFFLSSILLPLLASALPWVNFQQTQEVGFTSIPLVSDRIFAFISFVIIPPIIEELIFRGWLYGKLRARLNLPLSIFLTSTLFGLMHLQWNVGIIVFILSVLMCLQREITGTIYSGTILHILKNFIAFVIRFIMLQ